jgi:hypothetical protein
MIANQGPEILSSFRKGSDPLRSPTAKTDLMFLEFDSIDEGDHVPSPLRKGNFDLLVLMTTQESVHRILNQAARNDNAGNEGILEPMARENRLFLSNFYLNRLVSHFTGQQRYRGADEFLQELLLTVPTVMSRNDNNQDVLIDPKRIAEHILEIRQRVATEWCRSAVAVPESHMEIKRLQLDLLLKSYGNPTDDLFQ